MAQQSTKPYLLRAIYEWCVDQALTPYIAVVVDERTVVPRQFVKEGQIILNLGPEAAHQLVMGNELITCAARFSSVAYNLSIPVDAVAAIYARENGHGMAFEVGAPPAAAPNDAAPAPEFAAEASPAAAGDAASASAPAPARGDDERTPGGRPHLVRVK